MSRTDLDPTTLAASLRRMAGDGSVEWVHEPMQTRVLLDVADMLDENAKLRELCKDWRRFAYDLFDEFVGEPEANDDFMALDDRTRELGVDV